MISFFEKREIKGFFGLTSTVENIYFERWRIPVLIDERPLLHQKIDNFYYNNQGNNQGNNNNDNNNNNNNNNNNLRYQNGEINNNFTEKIPTKDAVESERRTLVDCALKVVQKRLITILEVIP